MVRDPDCGRTTPVSQDLKARTAKTTELSDSAPRYVLLVERSPWCKARDLIGNRISPLAAEIEARGKQICKWYIFEVARDEIITVEVSEPLAVVDGDALPSPDSFDPRDYAMLRVDDDGNAEWAVLKGSRPMTQRIETDVERREVREEEATRDAALKAVDWTKQSDASRQPTMNYAGADGCGDMLVYGWSADRAESIVIRIDRQALGLSTQSTKFDLSRETANIAVQAYMFDRPQRDFNVCSDVRISYGPDYRGPEVWQVVAGAITIEVSPPGVRAREPGLRRATVTMTNIVLRNSDGKTVQVTRPVQLTAIVGRVFG